MSIRIGVTDGNQAFFHRFRDVMRDQFPGEFELYLFPSLEKAIVAVERFHISVVLAEEAALQKGVPETLPNTAAFFLLRNTMAEEKAYEKLPLEEKGPLLELCRYRSADEWHSILLNAVSSLEPPDGAAPGLAVGEPVEARRRSCRFCLFTAAAGGTGTSTAALAFSQCCARHSRNVLYVSLETFSGITAWCTGENLYTLEDVLLGLRGRKYEPDAIFDKAVNEDDSGVKYMLPGREAPDLFDMTGEEMMTFFDMAVESGLFSMVVFDMDFDASERIILPFLSADRVVVVSDGRQIANEKTELLFQCLPRLCGEDRRTLGEKTCLLYNRFVDGESRVMQTEAVTKLGGIRQVEAATFRDLVEDLSYHPSMERLYDRLMEE